MKVKKIFLAAICLFAGFAALAQKDSTATGTTPHKKTKDEIKQERRQKTIELQKRAEEGALIYQKQSAFGFKLNTDGWGISYEHGKYKTIKNTNIWWVEFGERKSLKEERVTTGQDFGSFIILGNPFIYGKQNNFYYLKAGFGQQKLIGGKGNQNGVAVSAVYGGGLSLGYLKPYYLSVMDSAGFSSDIKYNDSTRNSFLDPTLINGASGFTKGFGEGKVVPGVFARVALRFDYGRYNEFLSALEIGINAEYYTKEMPIVIDNPAKQFFLNGYIAFEFGSRK